jgi:hypothetical protein
MGSVERGLWRLSLPLLATSTPMNLTWMPEQAEQDYECPSSMNVEQATVPVSAPPRIAADFP